MLILNVKTRFSCTLDYCKVIDEFVAKTWDLCQYKLTPKDWSAIQLVSDWLKAFCSATTQMSTTKCSMLSSTQAIFCGLQESLQKSLHKLPNNTLPHLKDSLIKAHQKLSDYYTKFDESPFYIWSSHKNSFFLDPQISYEGLLTDCGDDQTLCGHLDNAKVQLHWYYQDNYLSLQDILAIPGSAVAVEHIFSGGHDTISLQHASLQPNTIRTLMLLKQCLPRS
ncbi:uncharacterized protein EDB91DRAFT_1238927 [Suillus paluster]|uniref:uncharacterized protein n=1 Tax=Suillus paluster TaxID=48578 RepID=UPI001B8705CE|nr:uncharacterized protein EDB91DRAFT_1238927 [Suillus paluster]KAG1731486.1 hypothetical protein EDB91DRAFT_1238927 [Suillus paluster]